MVAWDMQPFFRVRRLCAFSVRFDTDFARIQGASILPPLEKIHDNAIAKAGIVTREALIAELVIKDEQTIRGWERDGMPYIKQGNTVLYHVPTIVKWLLKRQFRGRK